MITAMTIILDAMNKDFKPEDIYMGTIALDTIILIIFGVYLNG